jgi:hypothetical protein
LAKSPGSSTKSRAADKDVTSDLWSSAQRWMLTGLVVASTGAAAQNTPSMPGLNPCAALTVLAPAPAPVDPAIAAALAATVAKTGSTLPAAPFRSPKPTAKADVKPGALFGWDDVIVLTFAPVDARLGKCLEGGDLTLYLDHLPMGGIAPIERMGEEGKGAIIKYRLTRPLVTGPGWNELMAKAWDAGGTFDATVGLGTAGNEFAYADNKLRLTLGSGRSSWVVCALVGSIVLLIALWSQTKMLHGRQTGAPTYSISRFLLSCWVLTTMCAVLLMFMRTGNMPSASDGGLAFMLGISGATTGLSALIDLIRKPHNDEPSNFLEDFLDDADGLALHRLQVAMFNFLVLFIVWRDMIQLGTVAQIDRGWVALLGASAMTFVFGKTGESTVRLIAPARLPPARQPADVTAPQASILPWLATIRRFVRDLRS